MIENNHEDIYEIDKVIKKFKRFENEYKRIQEETELLGYQLDSFKAFASEVNHNISGLFKEKSQLYQHKHDVNLSIIDYDDLAEDSLETIKKQFDLLVLEYKNIEPNSGFKNYFNDKKEFDERDEIIYEKDSVIQQLQLSMDSNTLTEMRAELVLKNQVIQEYEHRMHMLQIESVQPNRNDISDFIEAENEVLKNYTDILKGYEYMNEEKAKMRSPTKIASLSSQKKSLSKTKSAKNVNLESASRISFDSATKYSSNMFSSPNEKDKIESDSINQEIMKEQNNKIEDLTLKVKNLYEDNKEKESFINKLLKDLESKEYKSQTNDNQLNEMCNELESISSKYHILSETYNDLSNNFNQLSQEYQDYQNSVDNQQDLKNQELKRLKEEIDNIKSDLIINRTEYENIKIEYEKLLNLADSYKQKINGSNIELQELQMEKNKLKKKLDENESNLDSITNEKNILKDNIKDIDYTLELTRTENEVLKNCVKELEDQNLYLKNNYQNENKSYNKLEINEYKSKFEEIENRYEELERNYILNSKNLNEKNKIVNDYLEDIKALEAKIEYLEEEKQYFETKLGKTELKLNEMNEQIENQKFDNENQISNLKMEQNKQIVNLEKEINNSVNKYNETRLNIDKLKAERYQLSSENDIYKDNNEKLTSSLTQLQEKLSELQGVRKIYDNNEDYKIKFNNIESKYTELEMNYQEKCNILSENTKELKDLEEMITKLEEEKKSLSIKQKETDKQIKELTGKISQNQIYYDQDLNNYKEDNKRLNKIVKELQNELSKIIKDYNDLKDKSNKKSESDELKKLTKLNADLNHKLEKSLNDLKNSKQDYYDLQNQLDQSMKNFNELQETYDDLFAKIPNKQESELLEKLKSLNSFKNQSVTIKFDEKMNYICQKANIQDNDNKNKSNAKKNFINTINPNVLFNYKYINSSLNQTDFASSSFKTINDNERIMNLLNQIERLNNENSVVKIKYEEVKNKFNILYSYIKEFNYEYIVCKVEVDFELKQAYSDFLTSAQPVRSPSYDRLITHSYQATNATNISIKYGLDKSTDTSNFTHTNASITNYMNEIEQLKKKNDDIKKYYETKLETKNAKIRDLQSNYNSLSNFKQDYVLLQKEMKRIKCYSKDIITILENIYKFLQVYSTQLNSSLHSFLRQLVSTGSQDAIDLAHKSKVILDKETADTATKYQSINICIEEMSIAEIRSFWETTKTLMSVLLNRYLDSVGQYSNMKVNISKLKDMNTVSIKASINSSSKPVLKQDSKTYSDYMFENNEPKNDNLHRISNTSRNIDPNSKEKESVSKIRTNSTSDEKNIDYMVKMDMPTYSDWKGTKKSSDKTKYDKYVNRIIEKSEMQFYKDQVERKSISKKENIY